MTHDERADVVAEKLVKADQEERAARAEALARQFNRTARLADALVRRPKPQD